MSDDIAKILEQAAFEASVVVPEGGAEEALTDAALGELSLSGGENIATVVEQTQSTTTIAEQLDDLADRAQAAEDNAEKAVVEGDAAGERIAEVTVEALAREFDFVLAVNGVNGIWQTPSLESKTSAKARAGELKARARTYAGLARTAAEALGDISNEASGLTKFLDAHKLRLGKARATLHNTLGQLNAAAPELKEHPHQISHHQIGAFMIRLGAQVTDLPAAIRGESTYLKRVSSIIDETLAGLLHALQQLEHNPDAELSSVVPHGLTAKLNSCISQKGELMGNHSVILLENVNGIVPHFKRIDDKTLSKGTGAVLAAGATFVGGWIGANSIAGVNFALAIGGVALGPIASAAVVATGVGLGVTSGKLWHKGAKETVHNSSNAVSIATAEGLKKAISDVLEYSKYTDTKLDDSAVLHKLDEVYSANKKSSAAAHVVDAIWNLGQLNEILYDQAVYTTLHMATVANDVS